MCYPCLSGAREIQTLKPTYSRARTRGNFCLWYSWSAYSNWQKRLGSLLKCWGWVRSVYLWVVIYFLKVIKLAKNSKVTNIVIFAPGVFFVVQNPNMKFFCLIRHAVHSLVKSNGISTSDLEGWWLRERLIIMQMQGHQ